MLISELTGEIGMKARYRYNWDTGKWDELFRLNTDICVISGVMHPDGSMHSFRVPRESPLADYYLNKGINH